MSRSPYVVLIAGAAVGSGLPAVLVDFIFWRFVGGIHHDYRLAA